MSIFNKIAVTDADGTLFNDKKTLSREDLDTLKYLKSMGICTAVATGRSIWSFTHIAGDDFPIDYLIFSCGAGVMDWKKKQVIFDSGIDEVGIAEIKNFLFSMKADFCIHAAIPDNHYFFPYKLNEFNPDFNRRCALYTPFIKEKDNIKYATQFLAIFYGVDHKMLIQKADESLKNYRVIRSTSPIDKSSLWMEIFQKGVSKAAGIKFISDIYGIDRQNIMSVGNDYNDVDMLEWTGSSFITENGPADLKMKYTEVNSNNESGFSMGVNLWLGKLK